MSEVVFWSKMFWWWVGVWDNSAVVEVNRDLRDVWGMDGNKRGSAVAVEWIRAVFLCLMKRLFDFSFWSWSTERSFMSSFVSSYTALLSTPSSLILNLSRYSHIFV